VVVPPGKHPRGPLCGNQLWRSPESWALSRQNQASDVFSFGIVVCCTFYGFCSLLSTGKLILTCLMQMIYVMADEMVFYVGEDQLKAEDSWRHVLHRHLSYFPDREGFNGLLQHIGEENPFYKRLIAVANDFPPGSRRQPFAHWDYVDPVLRDLVSKMTSLDPSRRITAWQALEHPWFQQTVSEFTS
jgi:serine/threonine protein kinase